MLPVKLLAVLCLSILFNNAIAQFEIPVDPFTGKPSITIPLASVDNRTVSHLIALSYNADGIRIDEPISNAGQNWNLIAGGEIYRDLKGLPDDFSVTGDSRTGWLFNSNASTIGGFAYPSDGTAMSCTTEPTVYNFIDALKYQRDTEPDIFRFRTQGLSGSFLINNTGGVSNVNCVPYQDVKVILTRPTSKEITQIEIIDASGTRYIFSLREMTTRRANKDANTSDPLYFAKDYNLYKTQLTYASSWKLTQIISPFSETIDFTYTDTPEFTYSNDVEIQTAYTTTGFAVKKLYTITEKTIKKVLTGVSSLDESVVFNYKSNDYTNDYKLLSSVSVNEIRNAISTLKRSWQLDYVQASYSQEYQNLFVRPFLISVTEQDACRAHQPYKFSYQGLSGNIVAVSPYRSNSQDIWGYSMPGNTSKFPKVYVYPSSSNASRISLYKRTGISDEIIIDGADRSLNSTPDIGVLKVINFPGGAVKTFTYESHVFLEPVSNTSITGGGLRIKKIQLHDGVSFRNDIVKEYEYLAASGTTTSGKILGLPSYSFASACYADPQSGVVSDYTSLSGLSAAEQWRRLIIRTSEDIGSTESSIVYERVREKQQGAGSTVYEYEIPNTWSALPSGDWNSTYSHIARSATCSPAGVNLPSYYTFPFAMPTPYDYAQGLVKRIQYFAEGQSNPVKETLYTYVDKSINGTAIKGLDFDLIPVNGSSYYFMYGAYTINADKTRVIQQVLDRVRDRVTVTSYLENSTNFAYASNHILPVNITSTNSDNTQYITRIKYAKDFTAGGAGTSTDGQVLSIDALLEKNRNATLIEQTVSTIPSGGTEKTISGTLTLFENIGTTSSPIITPSKILSLDAGVGISGFSMSSITGTTSRSFQRNVAYRPIANYKYNSKGDMMRSENSSRLVQSIQYESQTGNVVARIEQAEAHEVICSNFDNLTGYEFGLQGSFSSDQLNAVGRDNSKGLGQVYSTTRYLRKNLIKRPGSKYNLSLWYKPGLSTGTQNIVVTIKNTSNTQLLTSSFPVTNKNTQEFSFIQGTVDLSSISNTEVIVEVSYSGPTGTLGGAMSIMDDVLFYPIDSEVSIITNGSIHGITSTASTRGDYQVFNYDPSGRLKYSKDKNLDIVAAYQYKDWLPTVSGVTGNASIALETEILDNKATILKAITGCLDVSSIEWKVEPAGSASGVFFTGSNDQPYTFASAGFYDVTLKVSHSSYGSYEIKQSNVEVKLSPLTVSICALGGTTIDLCSGTPIISEACGGTSTGISSTIFKVQSMAGCPVGATYTYRWQKRPNGSVDWAYYGASDANLSVNNIASYDIRCVVTSSCGRVGYSNVKNIIVYRSNTSCSQP
ncbi:hypothetical protein [Ohtaekwangia koreensis]|uniref:YD repeat-containing protein n=1 Tax=Ohtaekwangia koreensis TaxID=688867 RepID=A0A1T5MA95_9BACT|nr:hypothetical protein [Ohtaekwangia koreensis]SKC85023.1 hypothetical protein SAMN05660236_4792 [Ohtaekwangia koreensis]